MRKAIFSGSFDPVTKGHMDIIKRAAPLFEVLFVVVCANTEKGGGMFTPNVREELIRAALDEELPFYKNVEVAVCTGMLADFADANGAHYIVRGVRGATEYEYESEMASINRAIGGLETVLFPSSPELSYQSSTFARDMILYGRAELALPKGAFALYESMKK